jgi:hypothetical protein
MTGNLAQTLNNVIDNGNSESNGTNSAFKSAETIYNIAGKLQSEIKGLEKEAKKPIDGETKKKLDILRKDQTAKLESVIGLYAQFSKELQSAKTCQEQVQALNNVISHEKIYGKPRMINTDQMP